MSRKVIARGNLIWFAVLAAILIALCFVNFAIPGTTSRFVGFVPAITKDIDINGGVASKYKVTYNESVTDEQKALESAVNAVNSKLSQCGYGSARASAGTNDNVYVEIPNIKLASNMLDAIGANGPLYITTDSDVSSIDKEKAISGAEVTSVNSQFSQATASSYTWGVNIMLNDQGKSKLASLTESASSSSVTLYIYVGDETVSSISVSSQINSNSLYYYGLKASEDDVNVTVTQILMGAQNAYFEKINDETIVVAPTISASIQMWIWIVIGVVSFLLLAFCFLKFGELGFITLLNYAFFLSITAFLMQAMPIFILSFAGIVGLFVGILLFFISNLIIYNSAKRGYAEGKKIPLAIKMGINNNVLKIVDISVVTLIASFVMYFVGGVYVQCFAITVAICAALNLLTSLAMNKLFTKWYTRINSKNAKKLCFTREEHVNELN